MDVDAMIPWASCPALPASVLHVVAVMVVIRAVIEVAVRLTLSLTSPLDTAAVASTAIASWEATGIPMLLWTRPVFPRKRFP